MKISRRCALKSLLSLVSYIYLSKVSFGKNQILEGKTVIVIGAGISGLVAASTLIQKGANVIILEAKNLDIRKTKISEILTTYTFDQYNNTTIQ